MPGFTRTFERPHTNSWEATNNFLQPGLYDERIVSFEISHVLYAQ